MALKSITMMFILHTKIKKNMFVSKNKFTNLLQKLLCSSVPTESLCQTLFHLIFWNCERISLLYPPNSSAVSSIINRGNIADLVIKNSVLDLEKGSGSAISNIDILEIFLNVLKLHGNETFKYEMLRMFEIQMNGKFNEQLFKFRF